MRAITRRNRLPHYVFGLTTLIGAALIGLGETPALGQEATEQDLQGVLPEFIPSGISDADFAELGGNWADWANETGLLVIDFYVSDDPEVQGRRATLDKLKRRVHTMQVALDDPKYRALHLPLADFLSRLAPRVALMEALLDTIQLDTAALGASHHQAAVNELANTAQSLQSHLTSIPKGDAWLPYLKVPAVLEATNSPAEGSDFGQLLDQVQKKLASRTAMEESQREFLSAPPVLNYEDAVAEAKASLVGQNPDEYRQRMRDLSRDLLLAIENYEEEPLTVHTRAIRAAYDDIRRTAPDGGVRVTDVMRRYYLNYNTRIVVDESLAQSLFNESRMESGFIREMVDNATVTGCQWTNTHAGIDFKPSVQGARFDLWMHGNVRARMQGSTHLATVYLSGSHAFDGRKEVYFNGDNFFTQPARVSVSANTQANAARTKFSPLPIIGRITENIAVKKAREQLPQANQRTRQQIYQEAKPRFDREAAQNFYEAELELERKVKGPLREQGLYPDTMQFTSSEVDVMARTRLMESGELGGTATFPIDVFPSHGILMQLHESLVNNAAERFDLEGKTFTPDELKAYMKGRLEDLTGRNVNLDELLPSESDDPNEEKIETVTFAKEDALRVQLERGRVKLILGIGFDMEGREPIAPQRISVELQPSLVGGKLHVEPVGTIGVQAIGEVPPGDAGTQITRANVMRAKMQDLFEPQDLDTDFQFDMEQRQLTLWLTDIKVRGGWVSAVLSDGVQRYGQSYIGLNDTEVDIEKYLPEQPTGEESDGPLETSVETSPVLTLDPQ